MSCSGGSSTSTDSCSPLQISGFIGDLIDNEVIIITFSHDMKQTSFNLNDISISIKSDFNVKFTWTASYSSLKTLKIYLNIQTTLIGGEKLTIKLINDKKFRTPTGG